jgi:hypothetical protein
MIRGNTIPTARLYSSMAALPAGCRQGVRAGAEALLHLAGNERAASSRLAYTDVGT